MSRNAVQVERLSVPFVVLGMRDEYFGIGRPSPGSIEIEHFYPHETSVADDFERCLYQLKTTYALETTIERVVNSDGHMEFRSAELSTLIASFYGTERGISYSLFQPRMSGWYTPATDDERISFLIGAYLRYKRNGGFRFANAAHKAEVTMRVLRGLDCPYVAWKQWLHKLPNSHVIEFEPSPGLREILEAGLKGKLSSY